MIYMVELDIEDESVVETFVAWWTEHVAYMLGVPGFDTAQRFGLVHPERRRSYVQLYSIESPGVMTSESYRAVAGPQSSGLGHAFTNWHRNLFDGLRDAPVVAPDQHLVLLDGSTAADWPRESGISWLAAAGLDRSVPRRGIAVTGSPESWRRAGAGTARLFEPLTGVLTKAAHARYK